MYMYLDKLFKLSEEELQALYSEYKKYCKNNKMRCTYCGTYNTIDRDCEIYGDHHPPISQCRFYFRKWFYDEREKEKG